MAFGPIMQFSVPPKKDGDSTLNIELASLTHELMPEFVKNGGLQSYPVIKYVSTRRNAMVEQDETDWFERERKNSDSIVWGIFDITNGRTLIGNTSLGSFETGPTGIRQAVSGILIFNKDYWGKGIASYAHKARTWYAFNEMGLTRIQSAVYDGNIASQKALESIGYQFVYTERNANYADGRLIHATNLECINPLEPFWTNWWGSDVIPETALESQATTMAVLDWAKQNVHLP